MSGKFRFVLGFVAVVATSGIANLSANTSIQLGPRPYYLVDRMDEGDLKEELAGCATDTFTSSEFSIGHRGAPLQFPEHTRESYIAAARMGAGIVECDVTFTKDRELVCRHSQCDLHTTTNILAIPELAAKCSEGFAPAKINDQTGEIATEASAKCCASDITADEFLSLKGKMYAADPAAQSVEAYLGGTAPYRTTLYTEQGTLMTHSQSIDLFKSLGVKMTPELKVPEVSMPFDGDYSQTEYAQQLVDDYLAAGVAPGNVWMQSFNLDDVRYWIDNAKEFGKQAVWLDGRYSDTSFTPSNESSWRPSMADLKNMGVEIVAPPLWVLLQLSESKDIIPSEYANKAKAAGLDIITWTLESSGLLASGGGWYYQSVEESINNDGDVYKVLDVLAKDVGVIGVFSDWPATVTYYANCMKK